MRHSISRFRNILKHKITTFRKKKIYDLKLNEHLFIDWFKTLYYQVENKGGKENLILVKGFHAKTLYLWRKLIWKENMVMMIVDGELIELRG